MGQAANVCIYSNLQYDLRRDFAPVVQFATSPSVVVVHPSLPVKSIAELVRLAKAKPGSINYASGGIGGSAYIAGDLSRSQAGVDLLHVPYRSGGEALTSVLSGETTVYFSALAVALPHIQSGKLRPLAVTSAKRVSLLPDYPTVAESGYPDYQAGNWYGILAPAKTPKETIATIRKAVLSALNNPTIDKRLAELGYIPVGDKPEEFAAHIKAEIESLCKIMRGLKASAK